MYKANDDRYEKATIRRAGNTGLQLPGISFGMWHSFGDDANYSDSERVILDAFDSGIFSFDLANNYGPGSGAAERMFGEVYKANLKPYRNELVVTTKAGYHMWPGPYGSFSGRKTLMNAIDVSLERMNLDYVDIFYSHRFDPNTNLEETAVALDDIVKSGKALYVGISNYNKEQTAEMIKYFKELHTPFAVNQLSYNMLNRDVKEDGVVDLLKEEQRAVVAYGPLAEGLLTNKYLNDLPADMKLHPTNSGVLSGGTGDLKAKLNQLNDIAQNRGQSLAQMATAWLLNDPTVVSVVTGASKVEHLQDNIKAMDNLDFTTDELEAIDKIVLG